jgi:hypothetical protein
MDETRFQQIIKWGQVAVALAVVANIFFVLRYREAYRDASRLEATYARDLALLGAQQQALEGVLRDFAIQAGPDARVGDIFRRYGLDPVKVAQSGKKP